MLHNFLLFEENSTTWTKNTEMSEAEGDPKHFLV